MSRYFQICRFPYSNFMVFDLVSDVEKYPEFLPWCKKVKIHKKSINSVEATLFVGDKIFKESFRSKVFLKRPYYIRIYYENGPLKYLYNSWGFRHIADSVTEVSFFVDFKFNSLILEVAISSFFSNLTITMVNAFQNRAKLLFGM